MKEYHTKIIIKRPIEEVWRQLINFPNYKNWNPLVKNITGDIREGGQIITDIVPLNKAYVAKLLSFKPNQEMIWKGKQVAEFLMAGKHYYQLKSIDDQTTELLHGEYFTGLASWFIPASLLNKMKNTFIAHNEAFKKLVENGK